MTSRALLVKPEWAARLVALENPKTWEIRGAATKIRGRVGILATSGVGLVGHAELVDCIPLTPELFASNVDKHQSPGHSYARPHAWVFRDGVPYATPQQVPRKQGQIIWVKY